jgi:DNA-binding CsgD family transcriptional regulator
MARPSSKTRRPTAPSSASAIEFPLDVDVWEHVAQEMRLSDQHKRIVELLLRGTRCKQLGPALGLAGPTVRTYLKRIYDRQGVANHAELLLRIMALSQQFIGHPQRHRSR